MRATDSGMLLLVRTLIVLTVAAIPQNGYYWTLLPEKVATHFGPNGQPDDWMSKSAATLLMLGLQLIMPWFFVGIGRGLKYMPASLINVPHREYWFAEERRPESLVKMQRFLLAFACIQSMFFMSINHLTFKANITGAPLNMTAFGLVLALFLVAVAVLVVGLFRRFRLPQS